MINSIKAIVAIFLIVVLCQPFDSIAQRHIGLKVYKSVKELTDDQSLRENDLVKVLGYYEVGDGGAAEYTIIKENATDKDEYSVKVNKNLHAILVDPTYVNYKMFGAKGDGLNNDAVQISKAHDFANKKEIPIKNYSGEFWLKESVKIIIQTNVDWGQTVFHIDESFNKPGTYRFQVKSSKETENIQLNENQKKELISNLNNGAKVIPLLANYQNYMIQIADNNDRVGYRSGASFKGQSWAKEELFYVEQGGKLIGDIAWQFKDYTKLNAIYCENNYLTITGGTFYLSGDSPSTEKGEYMSNGIRVNRSRTIISNQWLGLEPGKFDNTTTNPRSGFYSFSNVYDVKLENVRLIPYEQDRGSEELNVRSGTYGISMVRVLKSYFKNVTAEGSRSYWGVFGSNLNKDFVIEDCQLNRVDVHFHCWNLSIRNSKIGMKGITITGGGDLIVENTSNEAPYFINFRSDFGSRWDGNIYINNCKLLSYPEAKKTGILYFNPQNFDYKYPVSFGHNVVINNFKTLLSGAKEFEIVHLPNFSKFKSGENTILPSSIQVRNVATEGTAEKITLMKLAEQSGYKTAHCNSESLTKYQFNSDILFENIKTLSERAPVEFQMNKSVEKNSKMLFQPKIRLLNIDNINIQHSGNAASFYLENCNVKSIKSNAANGLTGKFVFSNCDFYPGNTDGVFYNLESSSGTSFTNCMVHAPLKGIEYDFERLDDWGFMSINRFVKFNHSNTTLSAEVKQYLNDNKIKLDAKFIQMLKSHHEAEPELMK